MTHTAMILAALLCLPSVASAAVPPIQVGAWAPESPPVTSAPPPPAEVPVQRAAPPPATDAPPPPLTSAPPPPSEPIVGPEPPPQPTAPVEVAPPPVEVAPIEPAPVEPVPVEPVEDFAPARSDPSQPPPLAGAGLRTGGGILVGFGGLTVLTGLVILGVTESFGGDPIGRGLSAAIILVGGAEMGGGVGMILPGRRRAEALREWEARHSIDAPKAGYGMIVGGSVLLGAGGLNMINVIGIASVDGEVPVGNLLIGLGELGAGAALLTIGMKRRKAYREWEQHHFGAPSLSLLPGGGMAVGLSGRF